MPKEWYEKPHERQYREHIYNEGTDVKVLVVMCEKCLEVKKLNK